jgi:hypothetical protein
MVPRAGSLATCSLLGAHSPSVTSLLLLKSEGCSEGRVTGSFLNGMMYGTSGCTFQVMFCRP